MIQVIILLSGETGDKDPDTSYTLFIRSLARYNPEHIQLAEFGHDNKYPFKYNTSINEIFDRLGLLGFNGIIFHCTPWTGILVSGLDTYKGKKILDIEDMHEISYVYPFMKFFDAITYRYNNNYSLEILKRQFPTHQYYHLPHGVSTKVFQDWGKEKEYDITFIAARNNLQAYPFRWKIYNLLKASQYRIKYLNSASECNQEEYSKILNASWLCMASCTISTTRDNPIHTGYYFRKYIEIPMSKSVILGYIPESAREDYKDNYVYIDENMSDEKILQVINDALYNKQQLQEKSNAIYYKFMEKYSYNNIFLTFDKIIQEINPRPILVYLNSNVGLGDQLLGYISCYWMSKVLGRMLYCNNVHLNNVFQLPANFPEHELDIMEFNDDAHIYTKLRRDDPNTIFSNKCGIKTGQNFFSALYSNPYTREKIIKICPKEDECIMEFFKQVTIRPHLMDKINRIIIPPNTTAIVYRTLRKIPDEALHLTEKSFVPFIETARLLDPSNILINTDDTNIHGKINFCNVLAYDTSQILHSGISESRDADERAFLEMYLVGKCKNAVISFWSNFSRLSVLRCNTPFFIVPLLIDIDECSQKWSSQQRKQGFLTTCQSFNVQPIGGLFRQGSHDEILSKHYICRQNNIQLNNNIDFIFITQCQDKLTNIHKNALLSWKQLKSCSRIIVLTDRPDWEQFCNIHGFEYITNNTIENIVNKYKNICIIDCDTILLQGFDKLKISNGVLYEKYWAYPVKEHDIIDFSSPMWQEGILQKALETGSWTDNYFRLAGVGTDNSFSVFPIKQIMDIPTVTVSITEGFGSILQVILSAYFYAKSRGWKYAHTFLKFEHCTIDRREETEFNKELNDAIINVFLPKGETVPVTESSIIYKSKQDLDNIIPRICPFLNYIYSTQANIQSCYDLNKINIAIHIRTFNETDCDPGEFRELFEQGSISDIFYQSIIQQLSDKYGDRAIFHLYIRKPERVQHYKKWNIIIHNNGGVLEDLHHFITADIFIMSISSLSYIANYYRNKPSIIRGENKGWHSINPNTLQVFNNKLTESQLIII